MDDVISVEKANDRVINITATPIAPGDYGVGNVNNSVNSSANGHFQFDSPNLGVNSTNIGYTQEDVGFNTTELVLIGAGVTVGALAFLAVILRILMPLLRDKNKKKEKKHRFEVDHRDKRYGGHHMNPHILQPSPVISHSSRSSASQMDWSEFGSNQTRSTYQTLDSHHSPKHASFGNLHGSTLSLPVYLPEESPRVHRSQNRMNQELVTRIGHPGLDPLKMGDSYRERWDSEFDPHTTNYSSLPRNYLTYLAHPSENRRIPDPSSSRSSISSSDQRLYGDWSYHTRGDGGRRWNNNAKWSK